MNSSQRDGNTRRVSGFSCSSTSSHGWAVFSNLSHIQKLGESSDEETVIFNPKEVQRHAIKNTTSQPEGSFHRSINSLHLGHQQPSSPANLCSSSIGTQEDLHCPRNSYHFTQPGPSVDATQAWLSQHAASVHASCSNSVRHSQASCVGQLTQWDHEGRSRQESRHHKHSEVQFQGFKTRYVCQKLQKELLSRTDGGLLKFLSLNSQFILKTGWKKEIIPRKKQSDIGLNQVNEKSKQHIPPLYNHPKQSDKEVQDILRSLSQLSDIDRSTEIQSDYVRNCRTVGDCDRDMIGISDQNSGDSFVASEPTTSQHTNVHKDVPSSSIESSVACDSEPWDSDEEREERYRLPSAVTSLGSILSMLNKRKASTQNGQELVKQSEGKQNQTRQETLVAIKPKYDREKTFIGNAEKGQPAQECGNSTSFAGRIKTSRPKSVGIPNKYLIDQSMSYTPRQMIPDKPMGSGMNVSNEHMAFGSSKQNNGSQKIQHNSFRSIEANSQKEELSRKSHSSTSSRSEAENISHNLYRCRDKDETGRQETKSFSHSSGERKNSENLESRIERIDEKRKHSSKKECYDKEKERQERSDKEKKPRVTEKDHSISMDPLGKHNSPGKHKERKQHHETERSDKQSNYRHGHHSSSSPRKPCNQYRNERNQHQSSKSITSERSSREKSPCKSKGPTKIEAKRKEVEEAEGSERKKRAYESPVQRIETTGSVDVCPTSTRHQIPSTQMEVTADSSTLSGITTKYASCGSWKKQLPVNDVSIDAVAVKSCPDDDSSYGTYEPLFKDQPLFNPINVKIEPPSPEPQQRHSDMDIKIENDSSTLLNLPMQGSTSISEQAGGNSAHLYVEKTETFEVAEDLNDLAESKVKVLSFYTRMFLNNLNLQESGDPYTDLQRRLKELGYSVWEEKEDLVLNWEVNLRWLMVKVFHATSDFSTFCKNIKYYMCEYPNLAQFASFVKGGFSSS